MLAIVDLAIEYSDVPDKNFAKWANGSRVSWLYEGLKYLDICGIVLTRRVGGTRYVQFVEFSFLLGEHLDKAVNLKYFAEKIARHFEQFKRDIKLMRAVAPE